MGRAEWPYAILAQAPPNLLTHPVLRPTQQLGDACCEFHQLADVSTSGCETPKRLSASRGLKSAPTCNWAGKGGKIHGRSIVVCNTFVAVHGFPFELTDRRLCINVPSSICNSYQLHPIAGSMVPPTATSKPHPNAHIINSQQFITRGKTSWWI